FDQVDVGLRAFFDNGFAQAAIVQHAVNIVIVDGAGDVDVELGVDMQGLGRAAFVCKDADTGVQRQPGKDDAACRHDEYLKDRNGIVRRAARLATIRADVPRAVQC